MFGFSFYRNSRSRKLICATNQIIPTVNTAPSQNCDVIIVGAGAAGLMCAIEAGKRGRKVVILEHNDRVGKKILISGGGRCNFTNLHASADNYLSENKDFAKSALARFKPKDFIQLVEKHGVSYHEKKLGQLFCDQSSRQIVDMLLDECQRVGVIIKTGIKAHSISKSHLFKISTNAGILESQSVVIATGGLSFPQLGISSFGYDVAKSFDLKVTPIKPGLVPFELKCDEGFKNLSGISIDSIVSYGKVQFRENLLITHRGLSGPAILQISSYWNEQIKEPLSINLLPDLGVKIFASSENMSQKPSAILSKYLSKRFVEYFAANFPEKPIGNLSKEQTQKVWNAISNWQVVPTRTEGYPKAEVTVGGVSTTELSSKSMESKRVPGLYFIGEVVDVTGWLGGFNFQWAWASGHAAGQVA